MRGPHGVADRFLALVDQRIAPAFATVGFERRRAVLERDGGDVRWLVEIELAPWTNPEKISFTLAWGVAVPGLDEVLGDESVAPPSRVASCPVRGRLGDAGPGLEAAWFTVGPLPAAARGIPLVERIVDARTATAALRAAGAEMLPALRRFDTVAAVQANLVAGLVRGRGAPADDELQRIRAIAGLSLLLGERENASRWLDYLEARSSAAIAPDVVAERLSPLRQRCAS